MSDDLPPRREPERLSPPIGILIYACNDTGRVGDVVEECRRHAEGVVVVDDASKDGTGMAAAEAGAVVLRHSHRTGIAGAIRTGLGYLADGRPWAVVVLSAAGEHDPSEIPRFLRRALRNRADLILGDRTKRLRGLARIASLPDRGCSRVISILTGRTLSDCESGFLLVGEKVAADRRVLESDFRSVGEFILIATRRGYRPVQLDVSAGRTRLNLVGGAIRFVRLLLRRVI